MKKIIYVIFTFIFIVTGFMSCNEEFLDQQPIGAFGESILASQEGIDGLLIGAYTLLNGGRMVSGADEQLGQVIHGAESFKGSDAGDQPAMLEYSKFAVTTGNSNARQLWQDGYNGVARCNLALKILPNASDMTEAKKTLAEAEAKFLRAHFYLSLKKNFGNVPWIDETMDDVRQPNTVDNDGSTYVNIWPNIAADMDFARKNLPATQADYGRPNKWAADAYYAKIQIYRANEGDYANGYTEALTILNDVINNGVNQAGVKYDLVERFHDNWNCTTENNEEMLWSAQCSNNDGTPTGGWGGNPNSDNKSVWIGSQSSSGPGFGRGWGFNNPTPFYADMFRVNANGLPYLDYYETNATRLKDDYGLDPAPVDGPDPFVIDTQPVDPRLDWTISRRGIPCLDYGPFPGASWIRNQGHGGPYMLKKWYIWKSEDGIFTGPGSVGSAMNIPVIRFADVLLLAAECEARVGSLDNARDLVNRVRNRMVLNSDDPLNWVKLDDGVTNAANYQIGLYPNDGSADDAFTSTADALDAILYERGLELGTEGHRFYDVVRFGKGAEIFNLFVSVEVTRFDYLTDAVYTDVPDKLQPIPRDAIDRSRVGDKNTLTQNPGY